MSNEQLYLIIHPDFAPVFTRTFYEKDWHQDLTVIEVTAGYWYDGQAWKIIDKETPCCFFPSSYSTSNNQPES